MPTGSGAFFAFIRPTCLSGLTGRPRACGEAISGTNGFNEGKIGLDFTKWTEGLEYINGNDEESYSIENMKFVCAVVIGTLDTAVETGTTTHGFPDNWIIK